MPAFLDSYFWNIANSEFWVGVGLVLFFAVVFMAGAHKLVAGALDAKAARIQGELDEAARLRAEAEALLAQIRQEKAEAEAQASAMLAAAEADARQMEADAKARLEESVARRQALAERKIAQAETQAMTEVKTAAVEMAARIAEDVLAKRIEGQKSDPLLDQAISDLGQRLN